MILGILITDQNVISRKAKRLIFSVYYRTQKVTLVSSVMDETVKLAEMTHSFFTWFAVSVAGMAAVFTVQLSRVVTSRTGLALCTRLLILT